MMLHSVIMAGGSGTRFWPQSRQATPKQLLRLVGTRTMLQQTAARCLARIPYDRTWVVTNAVQAAEAGRQLPEVPSRQILVEPCGRNTAPCIGLAALELIAVDPDAVMLVMPADHAIGPGGAFESAIGAALDIVAARPSSLVLFGAKPSYPATGFGYIERGEPLAGFGSNAYQVEAFKEKPDKVTAAGYVAEGRYYWNCGIFVWRADTILAALRQFEPELYAGLERIKAALGTPDRDAVLAREFPQLKSISIDYAVLERAGDVSVLEAQFEWDDVGSWHALTRHLPQDEAGNTVDGPFLGLDTRNCIIRTEPGHLVATIGLDDCIVVHTPTATLVARRHDDDAMRALIKALRDQGLAEYL